MSTHDAHGGALHRATGYAEWVVAAGFLASQCPYRTDPIPFTSALKRSMRTKDPRRSKKGNNARAVNAKATQRAAKKAKRARHNGKLSGRPGNGGCHE